MNIEVKDLGLRFGDLMALDGLSFRLEGARSTACWAAYVANPRTFIISTHLIEEVASLFEEVIIIDQGRLVAHEEADALRGRGATVTGPAEVVETFVAGLEVLGVQSLGRINAVTVYGELTDAQVQAARLAGLDLGPVSLQDLFVHLTRAEEARR